MEVFEAEIQHQCHFICAYDTGKMCLLFGLSSSVIPDGGKNVPHHGGCSSKWG